MGDDSLSIIRGFLSEYNQETGSDYQIDEGKNNSEETRPEFQSKESVDTSSMTPAVEEAKAKQKKKRAPLRLIEGGSNALAQAKVPNLDNLPTPGGIAFLMLLILFLLFALVPVTTGDGSNVTRLSLLWNALLGKLTLNEGMVSIDPNVILPGYNQDNPLAATGGHTLYGTDSPGTLAMQYR